MTLSAALRLGLTGAALLAAGQAAAGAFQIREGSAAAQGASFAGRTSGDRDVSYVLTNPAALRGVESVEVSAGVSGIFAMGDATASAPTFPGAAVAGDPNETAVVPSLALGWRVNDKLVLGLAVDAPFGLATKYDTDFASGFDGVESELVTISVTPLVSYDLVNGFTVAAGPVFQYADAKLSNLNGTLQEQSIEGDDLDFGFTLGALVDFAPRTTLGVAFQYGISHTLEGSFSSNFQPGVFSGDGRANLDLPTVISVGLTHGITEDWRVMGEFEWTGWSSFEDITIVDESTGARAPDPQNYDNAFFFALGAEYDLTDALTLRAGVAYDQTPTSDAFRTVRVPDSDRIWFSAGASYDITESIGIDAAYSYLRFDDTSVNLRRTPGVRVDYDSEAHIVALNARYRW